MYDILFSFIFNVSLVDHSPGSVLFLEWISNFPNSLWSRIPLRTSWTQNTTHTSPRALLLLLVQRLWGWYASCPVYEKLSLFTQGNEWVQKFQKHKEYSNIWLLKQTWNRIIESLGQVCRTTPHFPAANAWRRMGVLPCIHSLPPCSGCPWLALGVHWACVANQLLYSSWKVVTYARCVFRGLIGWGVGMLVWQQ